MHPLQRTLRWLLRSWLGAALAAALSLPLAAQWKTPWSYAGPDGPSHWAQLDPAYAACDGRRQSPVDIRGAVAAAVPALEFSFHSGPVRIVNNGYTAVRVDYAPGNGNTLSVGGRHYELVQFHFHHPSEERIRGQEFAMGLHIMMAAADGSVAGVAVMARTGPANSAIAQLWRHMPPSKGPLQLAPGLQFDPSEVLPKGRGYFEYAGSQTAPPCTENVTWYVMKATITISPEQIAAFAKVYPHDVRPVHPLNGRVIRSSR